MTHYCPVKVSICTFARIVFDYFPNGTNAHKLVEKIKLNLDENISYTSDRIILQSLRKNIANLVRDDQEKTKLSGNIVVDETLWTHRPTPPRTNIPTPPIDDD